MNLVIVESPAKAKTINKYLGKDYKVIASFGHVRDLPSKEGSVRPDEDFALDYVVNPGSSKYIKEISKEAKVSDAIYLATDPDREGEAISWHIVEILKQNKSLKKGIKIFRVAFYEITKKAVLNAIANPRDLDINLINAQQARRALDYLVGFTLSPVLWRKLPGSRSAGRVQSVALRLLCDRESAIEAFTSREYWDIFLNLENAKGNDFISKLVSVDKEKLKQFDLVNEEQVKDLASVLEKETFKITSIENKKSKRNPQSPFTTSLLQQEASRKLRFPTKRTMQVAQKLYEGIDIDGETLGLITYMRTDAVSVSEECIASTAKLIKKEFGEKYLPPRPNKYITKSKNSQEAHEAIRPTDVFKLPKDVKPYLTEEQYKLYDLIWKRMVSSQMESAIFDQVIVNIDSSDGKYGLRSNGSVLLFDGFYKLYKEGNDDSSESEDNNKLLPILNKGESVLVREVTPKQHFTQPPPRYTEASLVKEMEAIGIGRPSTYSSIISVLQERNYVKLDNRRFVPEPRGRIVTSFLTGFFSRYVEYNFTANIEEELDLVSDGKMDWKSMLRVFWNDFYKLTEEVKERSVTEIIDFINDALSNYLFSKNEDDEEGVDSRTCPSCKSGNLSLKLGKFGAFLGCSGYPECKYTKPLGDGDASGDSEDNVIWDNEKILGKNEEGLDISVRKGPYGFYVQLGAAEEGQKPKRVAVPKGKSPSSVTIEEAVALLSLPRTIGKHPETDKVITASIGRYGPYLKYNSSFISVKEDDILTLGMNRAVSIISEESKKKGSSGVIKVIGKHPKTGEDMVIQKGFYGLYIKYGKVNASIGKNLEVDDITEDIAVDLIEKAIQKKGKSAKSAKSTKSSKSTAKSSSGKEKKTVKKPKTGTKTKKKS